MLRWRLWPIGWAIVGVLLLRAPPALAEGAAAECKLDGPERHSVVRVADGETLVVDGGAEVRLIGAMAPRASDAAVSASAENSEAAWPLAEKAKTALAELVQGHSVELGFAGRRTDRYARLMAHVFVVEGEQRTWVQGEMLKRGLARAYALEGNSECLSELIEHEQVARRTGQGLWAEPAYAIRSADDLDGLARVRGTFQLVRGRVRAVSDVRGTAYFNFGADFRQDFTIVARPAARRAMAAAGISPADLEGRAVVVRGWIERRGGPMIEIRHPLEIETPGDEEAAVSSAAPVAEPSRQRRKRSQD